MEIWWSLIKMSLHFFLFFLIYKKKCWWFLIKYVTKVSIPLTFLIIKCSAMDWQPVLGALVFSSKLYPKCQYLVKPPQAHLWGVIGVVIMLDSILRAILQRVGDHAMLQCVTVYVCIQCFFSKLLLPTASVTLSAPNHDLSTTLLYCRQDTLGFVLFTWLSLQMLDTICTI